MNLRQKKKLYKKRYDHNPPKGTRLTIQMLNPDFMRAQRVKQLKEAIEACEKMMDAHIEWLQKKIRIRNLHTFNKAITRRNRCRNNRKWA